MANGRRKSPEELALHGETRPSRLKGRGDSKLIAFPDGTEIKCPAIYSAKTKKAFETTVPTLLRLRVLAENDLPALDTMFHALDESYKAREAMKAFDKEHPNLLDKETIDNRKKLYMWFSQSINDYIKYAIKFGITPAYRIKVDDDIEVIEQDPLDIVLGD